MLKKIILTLFTVSLLIMVGLFLAKKIMIAPSSSPTNTLSKLHVLGNRIVNEDGQTIRLRGVVFGDPFLMEHDDFDRDGVPDHHFTEKTAEDFARVRGFGANIVRLMIYPGYYRLVGGNKYLATYVDREVDLAEKNGLYIILGSGPKYSNDLSDVPKNPYSDSNLVYAAHIYPGNVPKGEDQVATWKKSFGFLASAYPVIVTEWGYSNNGDQTTKGTLEGYGKPFLDYLDQKNIHWTAFAYHPMDPSQGQMMLESDWTTLTQFGKFVKERLRD